MIRSQHFNISDTSLLSFLDSPPPINLDSTLALVADYDDC